MVYSNKQLLQKVLEESGTALTVSELSKRKGIPITKVRQTLTTWEKDIVRVGSQTYDLVWRVYPGKTFRHTPQQIEIDKGSLSAETDIFYYLIASFDYKAKITLYDEDNIPYPYNDKNSWIPVIIDQDEFGKYGYCTHCNERVIWESGIGWYHTRSDLEYAESYIPAEFFKLGNPKTRMN